MTATSRPENESRSIGRYVLYGPIARGGMATVHFARLVGQGGFSRIVAAKRLHEQFTEDPDFVEMFRNEARIASLIHHPNVVPVLDLVVDGGEVILVQEYVHGVPLDKLFRSAAQAARPIPPSIVVAIVTGILEGLHAAHETKDELGEPLGIIHRDVTPHNIVVSDDGVPRLLDFGIAKARSSAQVTRKGLMKGKLTYMAPEQFRGEKMTRKVDIYSVGVVMWELLTLRRLHAGQDDLEILSSAMAGNVPPLGEVLAKDREALGEVRWKEIQAIEPIVARMLTSNTSERFATANEAMEAMLDALAPAMPNVVSEWVAIAGGEYLERCHNLLASNEDSWRSTSKIAIPSTHPASGFKISTRGIDSPDAEPSLSVRMEEPRRTPGLPFWIAAGVLLFASALLVGGLLTRRTEPQIVAPAPSPPPIADVVTPEITIAATPAITASPPPPTPTAKPRIVWRAPPPPATHPAAAPPSATAPSQQDCDPPFYFDGSKKIFKPSCM
jgi:serine/threonine-protein kinase